MKVNLLIDDINLFEYNIPSISKLLKELQESLIKGKLVNPNWKKTNVNVRKFLTETFEDPIVIIKESSTQEGVLLITLIIPTIQNTLAVYVKTTHIPIFISKDEIGPSFLIEQLEEIIKTLRKTFSTNNLSNIPIIK